MLQTLEYTKIMTNSGDQNQSDKLIMMSDF